LDLQPSHDQDATSILIVAPQSALDRQADGQDGAQTRAIDGTSISMKTIGEFLKSTIVGGLLVLLPLLLLWGLIAQALAIVGKIAAPFVHLLPKDILADAPKLKELAPAVLLIGASFLFGVLLRAPFVRRIQKWGEGHTLARLPAYLALKNLVRGAVQPASSAGFKPAMLLLSEGLQRPAYVIEDHGDGNLTVFLPSAPAAFSGMVHVVSRERVVFLNVTLLELMQCITQYGAGQRELLNKKITSEQRADERAPPER
jgi:uncharacterized membrane protein